MGLKRVTARIEVTYPADDARPLEELRDATLVAVGAALLSQYHETGPVLAAYTHLNVAVDPDAEPSLPDEE
ncbi:MAG TPA: hypothetical protein VFX97_20515 [Pyrinomonadaceae bacterium]|nr:hypothetical protein [Pyrinomonadaceae bacterium]